MVARSSAASLTPRSKSLSEPKIHNTAYVHPSSNTVGEINIGANVIIAPGTSIRADEGYPFHIGEGTSIQDGVVIHGLEEGRVVGDNQKQYSVWVGKNSSITHMSLIYGPAYIGDDCFIGFRSTVFNARVGDGCIVMMHALIQDVEIAPGKYVPSGAVITSQQQADSLPDVKKSDKEFVRHVAGINSAIKTSYLNAGDTAKNKPIQSGVAQSYAGNGASKNGNKGMFGSSNLSSETVEQVRSLVSSGYKIGTEHVDERRFRTGSWQSCSPIDTRNVSEAIAALEACVAEHAGEYIRMFGIDPNGKQRVMSTIIQRPGDKVSQPVGKTNTTAARASSTSKASNSHLDSEVVEQVRNLLMAGNKIGVEHVDERRFRTGSWQSGGMIEAKRESEAIAAIETILSEYQGEYVRLIGINPKGKQRVMSTIIQRPGDKVSQPGGKTNITAARASSTSKASNSHLDSEVVEQVRNLLMAGNKIGVEHVDERRFRTGSWQSGGMIEAKRESEAINAIETILSEYQGEYVRLIGINPKGKQRVMSTIIQRPGDKVSQPASASRAAAPVASSSSTSSSRSTSSGVTSSKLSQEAVEQVRNLLASGYTISTEHVDQRRFRTGAWQSCSPINTTRESEAIAALEECIANHSGEYVRMIGVEPKGKQRVSETMLQRP